MRRCLAALLMISGLVSCAAPPRAEGPADAVPADFAVDVAILLGPEADPPPLAHRRPGRLMLLPDGTLRYDPESDLGPNRRPGITRRLTAGEIAEVWDVAVAAGLTDADAADPMVNLQRVRPEPDGLVYHLEFAGDDRRWQFHRSGPVDAAEEDALSGFVRHLADLAWATDEPPRAVRALPLRYDFGPDPYARYRR